METLGMYRDRDWPGHCWVFRDRERKMLRENMYTVGKTEMSSCQLIP